MSVGFRRIFALCIILLLALQLTACGVNGSKNNDSNINTEERPIVTENNKVDLISLYFENLNAGDTNGILSITGGMQYKDLKKFKGYSDNKDNKKYDLGVALEVDRLELEPDILPYISTLGNNDIGATEYYVYLVSYEYLRPENYNIYVDLQDRKGYIVFVIAEIDGENKIINIARPNNITYLVDNNILEFEETKEGELSLLELKLFEERFAPYDENGIHEEYSGLFNSYYDTVNDIDLEKFLYSYPAFSGISEENKEEYSEVERLQIEKDGSGFPEEGLNGPIFRYRRDDVNKTLLKYAGITTDDLKTKQYDNVLYSEKYDSYYAGTPGAVFGDIRPDEGYVEGNIYTFIEHYPDTMEMEPVKTCFRKTDSGYMIISRTIISDGNET